MKIKDDMISSNVKGIPISFLVKDIGEWLFIPYEGVNINLNHDAQLSDFVKKELILWDMYDI